MIPRVLHFIWLDEQPLPERLAAVRASWSAYNPGWRTCVWSAADLPRDLVRREALEPMRSPRERADIVRFELLARFGGVVVGPELECKGPLDPVVGGADLVSGPLGGPLADVLLGAVAGHPLMERAVSELCPTRYWGDPGDGSGAPFVTLLLSGAAGLAVAEIAASDPAAGRVALYTGPGRVGQVAARDAALEAERRLQDVLAELDATEAECRELEVGIAVRVAAAPPLARLRFQLESHLRRLCCRRRSWTTRPPA